MFGTREERDDSGVFRRNRIVRVGWVVYGQLPGGRLWGGMAARACIPTRARSPSFLALKALARQTPRLHRQRPTTNSPFFLSLETTFPRQPPFVVCEKSNERTDRGRTPLFCWGTFFFFFLGEPEKDGSGLTLLGQWACDDFICRIQDMHLLLVLFLRGCRYHSSQRHSPRPTPIRGGDGATWRSN